jgi:uncharacterized membrane protein YhaH (DUF805 family)
MKNTFTIILLIFLSTRFSVYAQITENEVEEKNSNSNTIKFDFENVENYLRKAREKQIEDFENDLRQVQEEKKREDFRAMLIIAPFNAIVFLTPFVLAVFHYRKKISDFICPQQHFFWDKSRWLTAKGRAGRKEYCIRIFSLVAINLLLWAINFKFTPQSVSELFRFILMAFLFISVVFFVLSLVSFCAVTLRRLHDFGMSGEWGIGLLVFCFVLYIAIVATFGLFIIPFLIMKGTNGQNRFGFDPTVNSGKYTNEGISV